MRDGSQRNCSQSISLGLICFDSWCIARAYPRTVDQERKIVFQFYTFLKHNEYNDVCNLNLSEKIRSNERDRAICSQSAILFSLEWFYSYCLARANPREKIVFQFHTFLEFHNDLCLYLRSEHENQVFCSLENRRLVLSVAVLDCNLRGAMMRSGRVTGFIILTVTRLIPLLGVIIIKIIGLDIFSPWRGRVFLICDQ